MSIIAIVKEHPVPIGLGVVVILLLMMSRGGSSTTSNSGSSSANVGAFLQSQSIAAQSNAQISALNSQSQIALGLQSVDRFKTAEDAATARMGIVASIFNTQATTGAQLSLNNQNNLVKSQQSMFANKENLALIDSNMQVSKDTIAANIRMNGDKLNASQKAIESDNNFKLAYLGKQTEGSLAGLQIAGGQAKDLAVLNQTTQLSLLNATGVNQVNSINASGNVAQTLLGMNLDYTNKNLPAMLNHAERVAAINGQSAMALAQIQTSVANTNAQTAQDASKNASAMGWLSTIGNLVGKYFAS